MNLSEILDALTSPKTYQSALPVAQAYQAMSDCHPEEWALIEKAIQAKAVPPSFLGASAKPMC